MSILGALGCCAIVAVNAYLIGMWRGKAMAREQMLNAIHAAMARGRRAAGCDIAIIRSEARDSHRGFN
jgi:hypothetical protein